MKKLEKYLIFTLGLLFTAVFTSCQKDDEPSTKGSGGVMEYVNGRVFKFDDIGGDSYNAYNYTHYILFTATSETEGVFEHECYYRDYSWDGKNTGRVVNAGNFFIEDGGKIKISINRGNTWYINYFTLKGGKLIGDNGDTYESVGLASDPDTPEVSAHLHPLEDYVSQYRYAINQATALFWELESAVAFGDTNKAKKLIPEIKYWQGLAKEIRKQAEEDGWIIEPNPYENKSTNI